MLPFTVHENKTQIKSTQSLNCVGRKQGFIPLVYVPFQWGHVCHQLEICQNPLTENRIFVKTETTTRNFMLGDNRITTH